MLRPQTTFFLILAVAHLGGIGVAVADDPTPSDLEVRFVWDPNPEPDIEGYRLHFGTERGNYPNTVDVGNTTKSPLTLPEPGTYYSVVTAYNTAGLEGLPSNEVKFTVPLDAPDATPPLISGMPTNLVYLPDSPSGATAVVSWVEPSATDDVGVISLVSTHEPGETFSAGTTTVTYTASDAAGNSANASFTVTVTSIELWRQASFGSAIFDPEISGNDANPDGDAWNNLAEYALGLDPLNWDGSSVNSFAFLPGHSEFHLRHNPAIPDVDLLIESFTPPADDWNLLAIFTPASGWAFDASKVQLASIQEGELNAVTLTRSSDGKEGEFFRLKMIKSEQP